MTDEQLTNIALPILVGGLILFMGFIVWDLAKKNPKQVSLELPCFSLC
jgi:hypothetical protein